MVAMPVRYSPDVEEVTPDEGQTIEQLNQTFDTILRPSPRIPATRCGRCTPRRTASWRAS